MLAARIGMAVVIWRFFSSGGGICCLHHLATYWHDCGQGALHGQAEHDQNQDKRA